MGRHASPLYPAAGDSHRNCCGFTAQDHSLPRTTLQPETRDCTWSRGLLMLQSEVFLLHEVRRNAATKPSEPKGSRSILRH